MRLACACILGIASAACIGAPKSDTQTQSGASLWQQIQAEVGDAACDGPQQCHTIAVGAKSCGGPEAYLAWSSKRSDASRLASLAARHAAARKIENERGGMQSDCTLVLDPGASCVRGRCMLFSSGKGANMPP